MEGDDIDIDSADEALELSFIAEDEQSDAEVVPTGMEDEQTDTEVVSPALEGSFVEIEDTQSHDYECSICSKTFFSKYNLQRHIRIHSPNSRSVHCKKCLAAFDSANALLEHVSAKHSKNAFICEDCGSDFPTKPRLDNHRVLKHNEENKKKKICPYTGCGRVFVQSSSLEGHLNKHLNIKPYSCDKSGCDKKYASRFTRNRHMKTCGADSVGSLKRCSMCEKSFSTSSNLFIHTQAVHDNKDFLCVCGKSFKYITGLLKLKKNKKH